MQLRILLIIFKNCPSISVWCHSEAIFLISLHSIACNNKFKLILICAKPRSVASIELSFNYWSTCRRLQANSMQRRRNQITPLYVAATVICASSNNNLRKPNKALISFKFFVLCTFSIHQLFFNALGTYFLRTLNFCCMPHAIRPVSNATEMLISHFLAIFVRFFSFFVVYFTTL